MTARGTAALLAAFAALLGYLWLTELRPREPAAAGVRVEPALLALPTAEVRRVELEEGGRTLAAIRRDGGWVDADGRPWPGDAVASLVETLTNLRPLMTVDPDPREAAVYGLGDLAPRLRVLAADGRPALALELGTQNPAWTGLYARLGGRREVVLLGGVLRWELEKLREAAPRISP